MIMTTALKLSPDGLDDVVEPPPPPPSGALSITDTDYGISLLWDVDVPSNFAGRSLQWSPNGTVWVEIARITNPDTVTYIDYSSPIGYTPHYRLGIALTDGSVGSYTDSVSAEITGAGQTVYSDSYTAATGTSLETYTNGGNSNYFQTGGGGDMLISSAGRFYGTAGCTMVNRDTQPEADNYYHEVDLIRLTSVPNVALGLAIKCQLTSDSCMYAWFNEQGGVWELGRRINGSSVVLASTSVDPLIAGGAAKRVKLEVQGTTVNFYVAGVLRLTTQDTVLSRGYPGFRSNGNSTNTTGIHADNAVCAVAGPNPDQIPPAAPTLAVTAGTGAANAQITHSGAADLSAAVLYRSRASGDYYTRVQSRSVTASPMTIADPISAYGVTYYYVAGMIDNGGNHSLNFSSEQSYFADPSSSSGLARFNTGLDLWPNHESIGINVEFTGDQNQRLQSGQLITTTAPVTAGNLKSIPVLALQVPIPERTALIFYDEVNERWQRIRTMSAAVAGATAIVAESIASNIPAASTALYTGVQCRKPLSLNPTLDWENGWLMGFGYGGNGSAEPLAAGSCMFLTQDTPYEVQVTFYSPDGIEQAGGAIANTRVLSGAVQTAPPPISDAVAWSNAVAANLQYWLDFENGNNADDGRTSDTAWKTFHYCQQNAPSGAVVKFKTGPSNVQDASVFNRTLPIHYIGDTAAVSDETWPNVPLPINPGNRAVIESPYRVAAGTGAWTLRNDLVGPAGTGTYSAWFCSAIQQPSFQTAFYHPDRHPDTMDDDGRLIRIPVWGQNLGDSGPIGPGYTTLTPAGWAEVLLSGNNNIDYGVHFDEAGVYVIMQTGEDPNTKHWWFGDLQDIGRIRIDGPLQRYTNIEFRACGLGLFSDALNTVLDKNIYNGGSVFFYKREANGQLFAARATLIEKFYATMSGFMDETATRGIGMPWSHPKSNTFMDAMLPTTEKIGNPGKNQELTGHFSWGDTPGIGVTYRDGTVDGYFNGIVARNDNGVRVRTEYCVTRIKFRRIIDDCLEPEKITINFRAWNNYFEHSNVMLSFTPVDWGPVIFVFNVGWRIGGHTTMQSLGGVRGSNGGESSTYFFKMAKGSPVPLVLVAYNTLWTDIVTSSAVEPIIRTKGFSHQGSGQPRQRIHFIGNIMRVTRDLVESVRINQPLEWVENHNAMATSMVDTGVQAIVDSNTMAHYKNAALPNVVGQKTNIWGFDLLQATGSSGLDSHLISPTNGNLDIAVGSPLRNAAPLMTGIKETYLGTGASYGAKEFA